MNGKIAAADIGLKRAYQPAAPDDGMRILVDRLWPRGVSKEAAAIDQWAKELAPSAELREWFGHEAQRWPEFRQRYAAELRACQPQLRALRAQARTQHLTLVYAAHDEARNNAVVLRRLLLGRAP